MGIKRWAWLSSLATAAPLVVAGLLSCGHLEAEAAGYDRFALRDFASEVRLAAGATDTGAAAANAVCTYVRQPTGPATTLRLHMVNPDSLFEDTRRKLMAESARIWQSERRQRAMGRRARGCRRDGDVVDQRGRG